MCNTRGHIRVNQPPPPRPPPQPRSPSVSSTASTLVETTSQTDFWIESRHGTPDADDVFRYYVHFPIGGLMQADITTNSVLLALLHYDLLQDQIVLYRRLSECPRTGTILKVRNPREDEDEVRGMARDAVHDGMRLEGMSCVCYPVDGESGVAMDGVNSTLSTGVNGVVMNGVLTNGVNGSEYSQHAEEDGRMNESMDDSSSSSSSGSSSDEYDDSDDNNEDDDDDAAAEAQLQADVEAAAVLASDASDASDTDAMDFYDSISEIRSESAPRDDDRDYLLYPYNC
ncbi:uncharacterized protein LDX57_004014 [Aspergillus melleus]|uniref:uncharacterized protein n=1 Tax=Aspergillus melleus TaxID=138277 RepID=UPI001E8D40D5|nr:uncharacterized protein LDX57_004014 [Aspergillus melleus]KAH8426267.1 hypothetical protein LDX57_004014 [Aspergillus melleus]